MENIFYVYILANKNNSVLYTGMTSELTRRVEEHRGKFSEQSFSAKYNVAKLVYYETHEGFESAYFREKQIKGGSRRKKIELIEKNNKDWEDLYEKIMNDPI